MSLARLVDVHTHVYLPRYAALLRSRTSVRASRTTRLFILDRDTGRPVGPQYWDRDEKLKFMDRHGIDLSVRLYGFGLLPLVPEISTSALLEAIEQISKLPHLKGIILGTRGRGSGLDHEDLDPVWAALEKSGLVVFLHPHYGVDVEAWGEKDNGHVLPLASWIPIRNDNNTRSYSIETQATTRLILAGVFDRFPSLRLLLAHSGGALPQLSSRLASCIEHDPVLYFDAVAYGPEELGFVSDAVDRALGSRRMLFGTDHPFFPPLQPTEKWKSVVENLQAIDAVTGWGQVEKDGVRGANALSLFNLV
ncbi:amidohydrolase 2 [Mycena olivaceomarginata]|nr:amidohydrolase 2 [Mycena olivaceomarginata]